MAEFDRETRDFTLWGIRYFLHLPQNFFLATNGSKVVLTAVTFGAPSIHRQTVGARHVT